MLMVDGSAGSSGSTGARGRERGRGRGRTGLLGCDTTSRPIFSFRQSVGTKYGDEAYPTKRGDKVWRQGVVRSTHSKPTLKRHAVFIHPLTPCPAPLGHSRCAGSPCPLQEAACAKAYDSPERARYTSPGQRPWEYAKMTTSPEGAGYSLGNGVCLRDARRKRRSVVGRRGVPAVCGWG
jgi:hypothetical protein